MKLVRARFQGFRLLDDLEINFATDNERNVTVVRAANESGKTTLLTALQWGLIGDDALPTGYSIRPMDLPKNEVSKSEVEIDYEIENRDGAQTFRLFRSVETIGGDQSRPTSHLTLFRKSNAGFEPTETPHAFVQQHFPADLREVFFTDGDRALSFIEGPRAEQQKKVRMAIEKMMGLSILESAIDHIRTNERRIRTRFDKEAGNSETHKVKNDIEEIEDRLPKLSASLESVLDKITNLAENHQKTDRELEEALKLGNREELANELKSTKFQRKRVENQRAKIIADQADLISLASLANRMMAKSFAKSGKMLDELRLKGQIPNKTVPILQDRLEHHPDCICGESLDAKTIDGKKRRDYIEKLIEDSRDADNIKAKVSDLYFLAKPLISVQKDNWIEQYSDVFDRRNTLRSVYDEIGKKEAELEARLKKIPDTDVQRLREMRDTYATQLQQEKIEGYKIEEQIKRLKAEKVELENKFRARDARGQRGEKLTRELNAATDLREVFERGLDRIKTQEVKQVSDRMNALFLEMIGADEESALITRAEITPEFRIMVYGRNNYSMNPSMDLNGASRRALTIAFVLALTEISGVEAPNVIDTPLGMMSGYVKTEVVKTASDNSAQLVLFLTHDEIKGCENILDDRAENGVTITNPAHYPKILKNDPGTKEAKVILCGCDHRSSCKVCDRYESSAEVQKEVA